MNIFLGGMAALLLFVGHIMVLGKLNDLWNAKEKSLEASNPGEAKIKAESLARKIGVAVLLIMQFTGWVAGLFLLPALLMMIYDGRWILLPIIFIATLILFLLVGWVDRKLVSLTKN
jgi:hypothetical protein